MIRHWTQKLLKRIALGLEKRKTHSIRDSRQYFPSPFKKVERVMVERERKIRYQYKIMSSKRGNQNEN